MFRCGLRLASPEKAIPLPDPATALRREVYACDACAKLRLGFERPGFGEPFYKLPPLIGAQGLAPILFVGLNPRRSASNLDLHDRLMLDPEAFDALAQNRVENRPYVAVDGDERHYRTHARLVATVFPGRAFEEVAAVTELYFCATETSEDVRRGKNVCAERYFARVVQLTQPRVIVAVGRAAESYLRPRFGPQTGPFRAAPGGCRLFVVPIRHPAAWGERGGSDDEAAAEVARALGIELGGVPPVSRGDWAPPKPSADANAPDTSSPPTVPTATAPRRWPWILLVVGGFSTAALGFLALCCGLGA